MEVQILLCIDVDLDKMPDKVKDAGKAEGVSESRMQELIKVAMRDTVSNILREKWKDESAFSLMCIHENLPAEG